MKSTANAGLSRDIQDILAVARAVVAQSPKNAPAAEPEEVEEAPDFAVYGLVANGCGHRDPAKDHADFISPLLLAA